MGEFVTGQPPWYQGVLERERDAPDVDVEGRDVITVVTHENFELVG